MIKKFFQQLSKTKSSHFQFPILIVSSASNKINKSFSFSIEINQLIQFPIEYWCIAAAHHQFNIHTEHSVTRVCLYILSFFTLLSYCATQSIFFFSISAKFTRLLQRKSGSHTEEIDSIDLSVYTFKQFVRTNN